jgi:hypothetical protein
VSAVEDVFWYAPERKWAMVVVKALQHKVAISESRDLESWRHLSDVGPANAVGGGWGHVLADQIMFAERPRCRPSSARAGSTSARTTTRT